MHVFICYDVEGWSFHQHAIAMKREWERLDERNIVTIGTKPTHGDFDAIIVSFWPLIRRAPDIFAENISRVFIGIRSYWELYEKTMLPVERQLIRRCAGVFAPSKALAKFAADWLKCPVYVLNDGVDTERFNPGDGSLQPKEFVAGWAGNCSMDEKRFWMAREACKAAGVKLRAVGMGGELERLEPEQMPDFYRSLSVYLCTSSEEGGPNGPLEAAACGVPVISTRCGAMPQFLADTYGGRVVEDDEFASAVADEVRRPKLSGAAALDRARAWSWTHKIRAYDRLVRGIASSPQGLTVFEPPRKPTAVIALLHVTDPALYSVTERLNTPSKHFHWQLGCAPPVATVAWARSKLLTDCMCRTDADVILMWDEDMTVSPRDAEHICLKALELDAVVSTLVSKRAFGHGWIPLLKEQRMVFPDDRLIELGEGEYAGAAMNAFPRTVLERLAKHLPFIMPHGMKHGAGTQAGCYPFFLDRIVTDESGEKGWWMTEDRSFCDFARMCGEKVYITLKARVTHHGLHGYTAEDGANYRKPIKNEGSEGNDGRSESEDASPSGGDGPSGRGSPSEGLPAAATADHQREDQGGSVPPG